jgi:hypothetical protein
LNPRAAVKAAVSLSTPQQKAKQKEDLKRFFTFHSTAFQTHSYTRFVVYVAKDHHQNTYCNTPKNEY